jgi:hypothetical protein
VLSTRFVLVSVVVDECRFLSCGLEVILASVRQWFEARRNSTRSLTLRTTAPVDDFGFVDFVALVVNCTQTRGEADGAVDVGHGTTDAANHVVVVVIDSVFVES